MGYTFPLSSWLWSLISLFRWYLWQEYNSWGPGPQQPSEITIFFFSFLQPFFYINFRGKGVGNWGPLVEFHIKIQYTQFPNWFFQRPTGGSWVNTPWLTSSYLGSPIQFISGSAEHHDTIHQLVFWKLQLEKGRMQKNKIKLQIVLISYHKFVSSRIKMMQHNAGQCQPTLCVCTHSCDYL